MRSSPPSDDKRRALDRKSTGDATGESSMKMVAASKMRGELRRLEDGKSFGYKSVDMMFKSD
jgi:hypothetical protein